MRRFWVVGLLFVCSVLSAQDNKLYDISFSKSSIADNLDRIIQLNTSYKFAYNADLLQGYSLNREATLNKVTLDSMLNYLLAEPALTYQCKGKQCLVYKSQKQQCLIKIIDADNGETMPYALVTIGNQSAQTDVNGEALFTLYPARYRAQASFVGYQTAQQFLELDKDETFIMPLSTNLVLDQVIVTDSAIDQSIKHYDHFGFHRLKHLTTNAPGLAAKGDIMHTVRSLPGVQSGSGGIGGHYVRGSSNGENQVLLEGVPIMFPYHLLGLNSVFDGAFVKDLQVYKSSFDPKYGGAASSVVDVHIIDGNAKRPEIDLSVSPQGMSGMLQTPALIANSSLVLYGRSSTLNRGYDQVISQNIPLFGHPDISFHDLLAKYKIKLFDKTKLSAFYYRGGDEIADEGEELIGFENVRNQVFLKWNNELRNIALRHQFNTGTFIKANLSQSKYSNSVGDKSLNSVGVFTFTKGHSLLIDNASLSLNHYSERWQQVSLGVMWQKESFDFLEKYEQDYDEKVTAGAVDIIQEDNYFRESDTKALFFKHQMEWDHVFLQYGFRWSHYARGDKSYSNIEPRLTLSSALTERWQLIFSLARMTQGIQHVTASAINFPQDLWYPAGIDLKPQDNWHYDLGLHYSPNRNWTLSSNLYYKAISNEPQVFPYELLSGQGNQSYQVSGRSYGLELNLSKNVGKWRGNLAYNLSKSVRSHPEYNLGNEYAYQFDRRHELKMLLTYEFAKDWVLGATSYFGTAHPRVLAEGVSIAGGVWQKDDSFIGRKNADRGENHNRLDLSLRKFWKFGTTSHALKLNVYNVTDSDNPMLYNWDFQSETATPGFSINPIFSLQYSFHY